MNIVECRAITIVKIFVSQPTLSSIPEPAKFFRMQTLGMRGPIEGCRDDPVTGSIRLSDSGIRLVKLQARLRSNSAAGRNRRSRSWKGE